MNKVKIGKGNLMGKKINWITIIGLDRTENHHNYWVCECECGTKFIAIGNNIVRGKTKSCGCMKIAFAPWYKRTHGDCNARLYHIWASMKKRTLNKNEKRYKDYGGRGIKVCDKWLDYEGFNEDMNRTYFKHVREFGERQTTIERKDVDGNYCLGNCTWATYQEQSANKRTNVRLELNGKEYTLTEITEKFNINRATLMDRIRKGWSVERSVSTPINYRFLNVVSN